VKAPEPRRVIAILPPSPGAAGTPDAGNPGASVANIFALTAAAPFGSVAGRAAAQDTGRDTWAEQDAERRRLSLPRSFSSINA